MLVYCQKSDSLSNLWRGNIRHRIVMSFGKIILLASEGLANDVIAARLDIPRQIVSKWRKRFCLARLPGLEAQPRGGRKARFPPQPRPSGQSRRL